MQEIYFDNASTTQVDADVVAQLVQMMQVDYGNPSSLHHRGVVAQQRYEKAAAQVLAAMNGRAGSLLFTSGGTESNNLAIFGAANALKRRGNRIVTSTVEHASVGSPFAQLEEQGFEVIRLSVDRDGRVSPEELESQLTPSTILVSIQWVNNETGTIQPIQQLLKATRKGAPIALFHTDAVQGLGKIPVDVTKNPVDLLTISGHKIHAPKGIGGLYLAKTARIRPILYGGQQQKSLRPGTENVPLAVAFGYAAQKAALQSSESSAQVQCVRTELEQRLRQLEGVQFISPQEQVSPYILCIAALGYRSETMLHFLADQGIYVSSGSACSKGAHSHVLEAMGCTRAEVDSALRISLNRYNTVEEATQFTSALAAGMRALRKTN